MMNLFPRHGLALLGGLLVLLASGTVHAQVNFKPLDRDDYTEVEERLIVMKGIEVGVDYAMRVRTNEGKDILSSQKGSDTHQDLRLRMKTLFHRDIEVHLNLETGKSDFSDTDLREAESDDRGRLADDGTTSVNAREAYLRYAFNPRSALIMGKHELSLGDRRGKLYNGISPGFTFDCQMGTWCIPFGFAMIGDKSGDMIFHIALQFTGWDTMRNGFRDVLEVEVFRLVYNESGIPLGTNGGPGRYNPADPKDVNGNADSSQLIDTGTNEPIYYDADSQDYFGFRVNWESGNFFFNFDVISNQGTRVYHAYSSGAALGSTGAVRGEYNIKGLAFETELGMRFKTTRLGFRFMNATGDEYKNYNGGQDINRELSGYYEITPGTYRGSMFYFNGGDSSVESGAGLGHSVNNKRLYGIFLDYESREEMKLGYSLGIYQLKLNEPILTLAGDLTDDIGVEVNNVMTWFVHKALKFQFEAHGILAGGAFQPDPYTRPDGTANNVYQTVFRVVYSF